MVSHSYRIARVAVLAVLLCVGCARLSGVRQRLFHHNTTVPAPELSVQPTAPRPPIASRPAPRARPAGILGPLATRPATWHAIGESVERRPIEAMQIGSGPTRVLLIGGIHGDEPEGQPLVERLVDELTADTRAMRDTTLLIVRDLNPDGTAVHSRTNANGVDLNRNFPASNWDSTARNPRMNPGPRPESEPETRVLVELIRAFQPDRMLVMHATHGKPMNNYDGPARAIAESMSQSNGYDPAATIGYPTPGSLGSYAGSDMQIPIITLELPRGISADTAWRTNAGALRQFVR
jgi:predicted deacylase